MNEEEGLNTLYPANNGKNNKKIIKEKKVEKIISGSVKKQKRSFGKRLAGAFLEDDTKSVGSYVFNDVLIPAAKAMISDMVGGGIEMLLFGTAGGRRINRNTNQQNRPYVSYGSFSSGGTRDQRDRREISRVSRARHDFDDIILETRSEAEDVLSNLVDLVVDYGSASVADLYELVGVSPEFTDNKYGWTDLRSASYTRVRGGYLLNLPRTEVLSN